MGIEIEYKNTKLCTSAKSKEKENVQGKKRNKIF